MEVFIIKFSDIEGRLDPLYYSSFFDFYKRFLQKCNYELVELDSLLKELYRYPTFYGITFKKEGVPVVKISNINDSGFLEPLNKENYDFIDEFVSNKFPRTILKEGDLVMAVRGATIGKLAYVTKDFEKSNINANLIRISLDSSQILPLYFWAFLRSEVGQNLFLQNVANTAKQTITVPQIRKLKIPLPPIRIQKKITQIMAEAYTKKKQNEEEAERLYNSIDDYLLTELGINKVLFTIQNNFTIDSKHLLNKRIDPFYHQPIFKENEQSILTSKYDALPLNKITDLITSGQRPKGGVRNISEGVPSLGGEHINDLGFVAQTGLKYIPEEFHKSHMDSKVLPKDILLVKDGATTGKVGFVPENYPFEDVNINEHLFLIRIKNDYDPFYVFSFLKSSTSQIQIKREITGATITGLVRDAVNKLLIPIPPKNIQEQISTEIRKRIERAEKLKIEGQNYLEQAKKEVEKILFEQPQ